MGNVLLPISDKTITSILDDDMDDIDDDDDNDFDVDNDDKKYEDEELNTTITNAKCSSSSILFIGKTAMDKEERHTKQQNEDFSKISNITFTSSELTTSLDTKTIISRGEESDDIRKSKS